VAEAGVLIALQPRPLSLEAAAALVAQLTEMLVLPEAVLFLAVAVAEVVAELLLLPT
jgi:hypothetical protein